MRNASAPARPCGFVRARTWQPLDLERLALGDGDDVDAGAHVLQRLQREVLGRHLPLEDPLEHRRALGAAVDVERVSRQVQRREEREALDVIPVRVREQDARLAARPCRTRPPSGLMPRLRAPVPQSRMMRPPPRRAAATRTRCCRRSGSSPAPAPGSSRARPRTPSSISAAPAPCPGPRTRRRRRACASSCARPRPACRRGSRRSRRRCARARGGTAPAARRPPRGRSRSRRRARVAAVRDALVLLGRELRVVDDQVRALAQPHHAVAHARELLPVLRRQLGARRRRPRDELVLEQDVGERRGVGDVDDRRAVDGQPVGDRDPRVVEPRARDLARRRSRTWPRRSARGRRSSASASSNGTGKVRVVASATRTPPAGAGRRAGARRRDILLPRW